MSHESNQENGQHSTEERARPRYDDVNVPVIVLVGFISAVVTLLTIAFVQGLYYRWSDAFVDNRPDPRIVKTIEEQKQMLTANEETGRLSIDSAMENVATRFAQEGEAIDHSHGGNDAHNSQDGHGNDDHSSDEHTDADHADEKNDDESKSSEDG